MTKQILMYLVHFYVHVGLYPQSWTWKRKSKKIDKMKLQDEDNCLSLITNQINKIHEEGGFWTEVMGWCVYVKL
jgi:hypothetical protein